MHQNSENINRLASESSPYLLLHAHNPVDWYPWGEEAFTKAREENKLVIISIGYSACHWCHVMENESFSDNDVAQIMNKHFVSIKVDREERPDIDKIYMDAAQLITGRGGWPLNAIAFANGNPVYAATYFPKDQWIDLLGKIQEYYENENELLIKQSEELAQGIRITNSQFINQDANAVFNIETLHELSKKIIESVDFKYGGLNSVPKFSMPMVFEYLLFYYHSTHNQKALEAVTVTLDKMASGGIYDQIGGGFARYSTDRYWKVPHFEKMLYDNAQLVSLYANAYKLTKNEQYAKVIDETLEFISREMTSPETGFYSAIDADSEGEEGKFYVWDYNELTRILAEDELFMLDYFSIEKYGNWENGKNILYQTAENELLSKPKLASEVIDNDKINKVRKKLLQYRIDNKTRPLTDTKIIVSWNALMIRGYIDAYAALGNEIYLNTAIKNAYFIIQKLMDNDGMLLRNYKDGKSYTSAMLDDYACLINAFIYLYQATFNEEWLHNALKLQEYTLKHFYDTHSGMFFYTSNLDEVLITRQFEISDQVTPSSNSVMAENLFLLGILFEKPEYNEMARKMLANIQENLISSGAYFAKWAILYSHFVENPYEIAIVGEKGIEMSKKLLRQFIPNAILIGGISEGSLPLLQNKLVDNQTTIYVCKDKTCSLPTTDLSEALKLINTSN